MFIKSTQLLSGLAIGQHEGMTKLLEYSCSRLIQCLWQDHALHLPVAQDWSPCHYAMIALIAEGVIISEPSLQGSDLTTNPSYHLFKRRLCGAGQCRLLLN